MFHNERGDLRPCFCSYCACEMGVAYTLLTSVDQNISGDLVRNLVSGKNKRLKSKFSQCSDFRCSRFNGILKPVSAS